ncbi:sugar-transfer associated ATP-grasp domain-containing protein [Halomonas venusta]|uniref:sugar-transfer associated ATP-grasp domain-containing protein n=1 Tax=Vreelandella venusta TaxID=44935 RepID=UPI00295F2373|nr:sugar-transfer associated ATP-grasp domain-containing protein [Halomonas venusta]MDW0359733.1 sugar-transfer associated ATP-grasp domain-containing protein [Halomonas venusta]
MKRNTTFWANRHYLSDTQEAETVAPASPLLPKDHHKRLMESLQESEQLALLKRFTLDFYADPDLATLSEEEAQFFYERGFLPEKARLYGLNRDNIDSYLSDVQRWLTRLVNGPYSVVFNNKILFDQVFGQYANVPRTVAVCRQGRVIAHTELWQQIDAGQAGPLMLVAKPLGGGGGGSIYFIRIDKRHAVVETNDTTNPRFSVKAEALGEVFSRQRVPFIINEYVQQGEFSKRLYPLTVNTVRALVVRHAITGEPYLVRAVLRVGNSESYPIDNFSLGGLSIEVNKETGELGHAVAAAGRFTGQRWTTHPDTGEKIKGAYIPNWQEHKNKLLTLFNKLPYLKYCGFDLILQDDDFVVLEGNSYSQVRLFQMHEPLLYDNKYFVFLVDKGLAKC